jgi:hypothetical protein
MVFPGLSAIFAVSPHQDGSGGEGVPAFPDPSYERCNVSGIYVFNLAASVADKVNVEGTVCLKPSRTLMLKRV